MAAGEGVGVGSRATTGLRMRRAGGHGPSGTRTGVSHPLVPGGRAARSGIDSPPPRPRAADRLVPGVRGSWP
ncbi:hypothetical protein GCM10018782_38200 [Streptomyces griseoaurantiacus]|nr:hypothetical protein GCM10018782_38200 [Streptomyces griseoaurantiacus]